MKKVSLYALIVVSLLLIAHAGTLACGCPTVYDETLEQGTIRRLDKAKAVFSGRVVKVEGEASGLTTTIEVEQWWKGGRQKKIVLVAERNSCEFHFTLGEKYLVFAYTENGKLQTGSCSGNTPLNKAAPQLKALEKGKDSNVPTGENAQSKQSDRQFDGLKGAVKSVLVERADAKINSRNVVESKKRKVEFVEYEATGRRLKWQTYHWQSGTLFDSTSYKWVNGEKLSISEEVESKDRITVLVPDSLARKPADPSYDFKLKYKYDTAGRVTEESWWKNDGDLWLRYEYLPIEGGRQEFVYDAKGDLNQKYKYLTDSKGNDVEMISYSTETGQVGGKEKYEYSAFDSFGNWTKRVEWEADKEGKFVYKLREVKFRTFIYFLV